MSIECSVLDDDEALTAWLLFGHDADRSRAAAGRDGWAGPSYSFSGSQVSVRERGGQKNLFFSFGNEYFVHVHFSLLPTVFQSTVYTESFLMSIWYKFLGSEMNLYMIYPSYRLAWPHNGKVLEKHAI